MFPWNQTANGFHFLKLPTQFPEEPFLCSAGNLVEASFFASGGLV